jgi:hypothetical protein
MEDLDWYKCRFLESAENLKPLVRARIGRTPSTALAREIAACLQQGRLFYEAAQRAPLELRPLQQFYGMVGFAKALILGRQLTRLATLPQAHGLSDVSGLDFRIADLKAKIQYRGIFQKFNDVVKSLNRIRYFDGQSTPRTAYLCSTGSEQLDGLELSLREVLSRIPNLQSLFFNTFGELANTDFVSLDDITLPGCWSIRIDDRELFTDRQSIRNIVVQWRNRFPFLNSWRFTSAQHAWGNSVIMFADTANVAFDEFAEETLVLGPNGYSATVNPAGVAGRPPLPLDRLSPLAGGYSTSAGQFAISPIAGNIYLSEFSLHFMALFILSSLVRYRTPTWAHAISRTSISDAPADDQALALIERFLELNAEVVPSFVVTVLNPNEDRYA